MKRLNIAMLSQEGSVQEDASSVDEQNAEVVQADSEIREQSAVIDEAIDSSESIGNLTEKLETTQDTSDEAIEVAQEAMRYFINRHDIRTRAMVAFESHGSARNKKVSKEEIIKQMKIAKESLDKNIAIAQEGLMARIAHRLDAIFTYNSTIVKKLEGLRKELSMGRAEPISKTFSKPAFARSLNPDNKSEITEKDVFDLIKRMDTSMNSQAVISVVDELNDIVKTFVGIAANENNSNQVRKDKVARDLLADMNKMDSKIEKAKELFSFGTRKNDADIEPVSKEQALKLIDLVLSNLKTGKVEKAFEDLEKTVDNLDRFIESDNTITPVYTGDTTILIQSANPDAATLYNQTFKSVRKSVNSVGELYYEMYTLQYHIAFSTYKYIKYSYKL